MDAGRCHPSIDSSLRAEERANESETRLSRLREGRETSARAEAEAEARRLAEAFQEKLSAAKKSLQEDRDRSGYNHTISLYALLLVRL